MSVDNGDEVRIPIVEERVQVDKVIVATDRVRVHTVVDEQAALVEDVLQTGVLDVRHVPFDREVVAAPDPREEGDTLIVSIVEERLVKRLFLIEEVHVTRSIREETVSVPVSLRRMRAVVEQVPDLNQQGNHDG